MRIFPAGMVRRGGYTLADQILSSGTNFATAILVARLLGPADYGSYVIVYGAWIVVMGFTRTMIVNPYVVRSSALDRRDWLMATETAAGIVLCAGFLGGVIIAGVGLSLGITHPIGHPLLIMSLFVPVLTLQDYWRFAAFSIAEPQKALVNDAVWTVTQAIAFLMIFLLGLFSPAWMIAGWGAGSLAGAIFGVWQFRTIPKLGRDIRIWLRENSTISGWFGLASLFYSLGTQIVTVLIVAIAGRATLGGIQSVNNIFGPAQLITSASQTIGLPLASKARAEEGPGAVRRIAFRYALFVGFCMTAYASVVLGAGPFLLSNVFGEAFSRYATLIPPLTLGFMLTSWGTGAVVGLVSSAAGRELAGVQLLVTLTQIVAVSVLSYQFGALGAAYGFACGAVVHFAGVWFMCMRITGASPAPSGMGKSKTLELGQHERSET